MILLEAHADPTARWSSHDDRFPLQEALEIQSYGRRSTHREQILTILLTHAEISAKRGISFVRTMSVAGYAARGVARGPRGAEHASAPLHGASPARKSARTSSRPEPTDPRRQVHLYEHVQGSQEAQRWTDSWWNAGIRRASDESRFADRSRCTILRCGGRGHRLDGCGSHWPLRWRWD
jgi:hypothetical protein